VGQASATWAGALKNAGFVAAGEIRPKWFALLKPLDLKQRDEIKKTREECAQAVASLASLKRQQAEGPPKCFTIGCNVVSCCRLEA
jgi:hypothetical protein